MTEMLGKVDLKKKKRAVISTLLSAVSREEFATASLSLWPLVKAEVSPASPKLW